jgi:regulator of sigma E protease
MLDVVWSILAFIVAIGVLVAVHEFGHFWVARRLGFKVLRFSIGFGKPLVRWRSADRDRTEYWLSAIPLGGYVKMLDEREGPVPEADLPRAFNRRPVPHRVAVLLAGPGFNFLLAIVAYWVMFTTGVPGIKPLIGTVTPGSVAAQAGLTANDEIIAVGGAPTETWEEATLAILDELLADARIDLTLRGANGNVKNVEFDVRGRESELTEPAALFSGLGFRPGPVLSPVLGELAPDSPAERAGLRPGDRISSVAGQSVISWDQWRELVRERPGQRVDVTILRGEEKSTVPVTLGASEENGATVGQIGAWPQPLAPEYIERLRTEQRYGVLESLPRGIGKTWEMSALTVRMLGRMVIGDVSVRNISGPVAIATYAGDSAEAGLSAFLSFLAIVSISLGILNLLPVPMLDGGQIVYQVAEWLKGSPLSERALIIGQQVSMIFLIVTLTFVFYNDLSRLFGG